MFGTVLVVAYSMMLAYVAWRAWSVPPVSRHLSAGLYLATVALLWVPFAVSRLARHGSVARLAGEMEPFGMLLLGSVFIVAVATLAADLATGFGWLFPARAPLVRGWAMAAGLVAAVFAVVQGFRAPAIVSYEVALPGLPARLDGRVLVAMSDAHLGRQLGAEWMAERVRQAAELKPDIVVFLGDMFEGHGDAPREIPALRRLSAPLGKWFVTGNHESHGNGGEGMEALEGAGFRRLADSHAEPARGLVLAGVNDLTRHGRRNDAGDPLAKALAKRPKGAATVLLSHSPLEAERAAAAGVGLMLSGHTHGGQIWPFGYLIRRVYPLFAGRYDVGGMTVIVTRGVGTWGPRMRLWRRGEILKVVLRAPRNDAS